MAHMALEMALQNSTLAHTHKHVHPQLHETAFYTTLPQNCTPPLANIVFSFSPFRLFNRVS